MTSAARTSRWSRRTVAFGVASLVGWQALVVVDGPTDAALVVGVFGFVLHVLLGKAYALVPSYFDRTLTPSFAPAVSLPLTAGGTALLALGVGRWPGVPSVPLALAPVGALVWTLGVFVFVGSLAWTVRDNLSGAETGTGEHNAHRRRLDRLANPFVLVACAYLLVGSVDLVGVATGGPTLVATRLAGVVHLVGAGGAVLALVAVGFRLLPRLLATRPPARVAFVALPAGALGPVLLASSLGAGPLFVLGAVCEALAVTGFAGAVLVTFRRSDRRRVGFWGVLGGLAAGTGAVLLGLHFAVGGLTADLLVAHRRLNLVGLLGLSVVGVAFQFYPPAAGASRLVDDRTAALALATLGGGLAVEVVGLLALTPMVPVGRALVFVGATLAGIVVFDVFRARR